MKMLPHYCIHCIYIIIIIYIIFFIIYVYIYILVIRPGGVVFTPFLALLNLAGPAAFTKRKAGGEVVLPGHGTAHLTAVVMSLAALHRSMCIAHFPPPAGRTVPHSNGHLLLRSRVAHRVLIPLHRTRLPPRDAPTGLRAGRVGPPLTRERLHPVPTHYGPQPSDQCYLATASPPSKVRLFGRLANTVHH